MITHQIEKVLKAGLFIGAFALMSSCGSPGDRAKSKAKRSPVLM